MNRVFIDGYRDMSCSQQSPYHQNHLNWCCETFRKHTFKLTSKLVYRNFIFLWFSPYSSRFLNRFFDWWLQLQLINSLSILFMWFKASFLRNQLKNLIFMKIIFFRHLTDFCETNKQAFEFLKVVAESCVFFGDTGKRLIRLVDIMDFSILVLILRQYDD